MKRVAVFASGNGGNFSALVAAARRGKITARIALLVCDNRDAFVVNRAHRAGIPAAIIARRDSGGRNAFEDAVAGALNDYAIDVIALAGFMRILSPRFIGKYTERIINIHPSLLPSFKGAHAVEDACDYGVRVTGVTVHFVDERVDHGPIILQQAVPITASDTPHTLEEKIHRVEHKLYPQALQLLVTGKLRIQGRRVVINP